MKKMTKRTTKKAGKKTSKKASSKTSKRQTKANQCCVLWGPCKAAPKAETSKSAKAWMVVREVSSRHGIPVHGVWEIHPDHTAAKETKKGILNYLLGYYVDERDWPEKVTVGWLSKAIRSKESLGIAQVDIKGRELLHPTRVFAPKEVEVIYRPQPSKLDKLWGKITGRK